MKNLSAFSLPTHSLRSWALAGSALVVLSGCASVLPSLTGENPSGAKSAKPAATAPASKLPVLGTSQFQPAGVTSGKTTGTQIGQKVQNYRAELQALQNQIAGRNASLQGLRTAAIASAQRYHGMVGSVEARLQTGSTPGNPELVAMWNSAQGELEKVNAQIGAMTNLANSSAGDANAANFLLDNIRGTFLLSGAVEEDHRQLRVLEDETSQTVILVERLLTEVSDDVARQNAYISNERTSLQTLSLAVQRGELFGTSLTNASRYAAAQQLTAASPALMAPAGRRPIVVIRFDNDQVPYEQALYTAVQTALNRNPNAKFDLVQVVPSAGAPADVALAATKTKQYSDRVMRSLTDMGLPANRISVQTVNDLQSSVSEVQIYSR